MLSLPVPYRYCPILTTNFPSFSRIRPSRFLRTTIEHIDIPRRKGNNNQGRGGPAIALVGVRALGDDGEGGGDDVGVARRPHTARHWISNLILY